MSVLFGDVFRAFNPWRAIGRAVAWVAQTRGARTDPRADDLPGAARALACGRGDLRVRCLELVASNGDKPENVAVATLVYSALTFVAMALYGVEGWCEQGEAFGVYFNLFSRISPLCRRDGQIGLRRPLSGLPALVPVAGTVPLLAVMIGSVTFDGAAEAPIWTNIAPDSRSFFRDLGLSPARGPGARPSAGSDGGDRRSSTRSTTSPWRGADSVGGGFSADRPGQVVRAHARSDRVRLRGGPLPDPAALPGPGDRSLSLAFSSNPLGENADLFGTADSAIDYGVIGATATWYWQVGLVVVGHVAALTLAHDRALAIYDDTKKAVRSQYWMLVVMIGFTSLALWLLSQSNA